MFGKSILDNKTKYGKITPSVCCENKSWYWGNYMRQKIVRQGDVIVRKQDKVMEWYLIQEGRAAQRFGLNQMILERNSIIGILESDWFICDYVALEDTKLIILDQMDADGLGQLLKEHENFRAVFLRAAIEQKYQAIRLYEALREKCALLHGYSMNAYHDYCSICHDELVPEKPFLRMEAFEPVAMTHKVENWEIKSAYHMRKQYLKEFLMLMIRDDAMCVGAIMEAGAQVRRTSLGIAAMDAYLQLNRDIFWSESHNDLFHLYFDLAIAMSAQQKSIDGIRGKMEEGYQVMKKLGIYTEEELKSCRDTYENYDFSMASKGLINVAQEDSLTIILNYAKLDEKEALSIKNLFKQYKAMKDPYATDDVSRRLRRQFDQFFYKVYEKVFFEAVDSYEPLSPIIQMFLNFGFMDGDLMGSEYTRALQNLTDHMSLFHSNHVYTIFEWLEAIYFGEKQPSRNEFDLDYDGYLQELQRNGEISESKMLSFQNDTNQMVRFEIRNLFHSGHRTTFGKITTFFPVLRKDEMINDVQRMAVTADRLDAAINQIREIDYSLLYRPVSFSDPKHGMPQEWIQKEIMPDIILMPDAGSKAMMWQENCGRRADTPARFIFPIFTAVDLDQMMLETMGRYRWEICRRIQGAYWNDIRTPSLTSEYCDYVQFCSKNSELSAEQKEKVKATLKSAKNNYKEVFVRDYVNWIRYESQGSFRLNKVARGILVQYCPFPKEIRESLKQNPVFQKIFEKHELQNTKTLRKLEIQYEKYEEAGGEITQELQDNLRFYQF